MTESKAHYRTRRRTDPPPKPIAAMQLVEISERQRILAGHDAETETSVYVLRKRDDGEWLLYLLPIPELDQSLRSFITADDAELAELVTAIHETNPRPKRKPRKRRSTK